MTANNKTTERDIRYFALIWTGICLFFALKPMYRSLPINYYWLGAGIIFILAQINPNSLNLIFKLWIALGKFIGNIMSRIMLFILFYLIFTPFGFVIRLFGGDLLSTKPDGKADTYWIDRTDQPTSLKNQF